jgi:hypothetical protein
MVIFTMSQPRNLLSIARSNSAPSRNRRCSLRSLSRCDGVPPTAEAMGAMPSESIAVIATALPQGSGVGLSLVEEN